jgi:ribosomal protein S27E
MGAIWIYVGVVAVVFAMVAAYWMRRRKPQMAGYGLQRMCPSCGLITPRANVACVECGKVMAAGR